MRIKLFTVDSQSVKLALVLRTRATAVFRPFSSEGVLFSDFASFSDMAEPFDNALKTSDFIVVFTSLKSYPETKEVLIRALHLDTEYRFDIYSLAGDALAGFDLRSREASVHTELPVGAALFVPTNGLFPGFCVHSKNQYIMFLPFDENITPGLLKGRVSSFLDDINRGIENIEDKPVCGHAEICGILADAGVQVAIARTPAADFISLPGARVEGFFRYFHICGQAEPRNNESARNYVIRLAIMALKSLDCPYGIAISNIFTHNAGGAKEYTVYFAVASRKTATCSQLTALEDEGVDDFYARCVNELFTLLKKRLFEENPILGRLR